MYAGSYRLSKEMINTHQLHALAQLMLLLQNAYLLPYKIYHLLAPTML